jgi:hypothetical protein
MQSVTATRAVLPASTRRFYLWMGLVFVLIAFGGFTPTYWAPVVAGPAHVPPIAHVHGALLFSWTLFYLGQTAWVATGRTATHRMWGMAGIALFTLLLCSIVALKVTMIRIDDVHGFGEASRRFASLAFFGIAMMIVIFWLAIANIHRPEVHKRFMYLLLSGMMVPALARVFLTLLAPAGASQGEPPSPFVAIPPAVAASLLVVVAMIYDWRTEGRRSRVYVYGAPALVLTNVAAALASRTDTWMRVVGAIEGLAGS